MNRAEEINKMIQEAGTMMEGEDEAYIGAYFYAPENRVKMTVAEGGSLAALTFLVARIILCIATTHEVKPMALMNLIRRALKLMIKYHKKGVPIGEIETRNLGIH